MKQRCCMTRHDPLLSVRQMLDHTREAVQMAHGRTRGDLDTDRSLNLSLTHLVEIVGEAASRVSEEFRHRYPAVPWHQTIGTRNRLIHGYDTVDFDILWTIVTQDLPPLVELLERILQQEEG